MYKRPIVNLSEKDISNISSVIDRLLPEAIGNSNRKADREENGAEKTSDGPEKVAAEGDHLQKVHNRTPKEKGDKEIQEAKTMKDDDPCWDSHEMVGHKTKNGKKVPNCVPKEEVEAADADLTEAKLDPVNKKAVKKDFKDRKDKDIDNDGDSDESDVYLHKRRKAISKAVKKEEVSLAEQKESRDIFSGAKAEAQALDKMKEARRYYMSAKKRGIEDKEDAKLVDQAIAKLGKALDKLSSG